MRRPTRKQVEQVVIVSSSYTELRSNHLALPDNNCGAPVYDNVASN